MTIASLFLAVAVGCSANATEPSGGSSEEDVTASRCHFPVTCEDGTKGCADKHDPCAKHGGECSAKGDACVTEHDCCSGKGLRCDNEGASPTFNCVAACRFPVTCGDGTKGCADTSDPCADHGGECSAKGDACVTEHDCCAGLKCDNESAHPTFNCVAK
jgi:hypothetical protein